MEEEMNEENQGVLVRLGPFGKQP